MVVVTLSAGLKKTNYGSEVQIMNYIFFKTSEFMSANLVIFNKILEYIYNNNINYKMYNFISANALTLF